MRTTNHNQRQLKVMPMRIDQSKTTGQHVKSIHTTQSTQACKVVSMLAAGKRERQHSKAQRNRQAAARTRCVRRSYEEVAVIPLVKPRSCLNVKFRWNFIRTLRSNFPANRPGVTQWVHPRFPQDGVITLQLPRENANRLSTDESRVQLMSLEWV